MNQIILKGYVGQAPIKSVNSNDVSMAKLTLATSSGYKKDGEWKNRTTWHNLRAFKNQADRIFDKVGKGDQVFIIGKQEHYTYEKNGQAATMSYVIINSFEVIKKKEAPVSVAAAAEAQPMPEDKTNSDEVIPF
ncbi:MAG: single-stranded DNA-binding protein [Bacteroidota bacterium]